MEESQKAEFLKRISTVGSGLREDIQMLLGGVVCDLRDLVFENVFSEDEMDAVVAFHDDAEDLWHLSMATNPPMEPEVMIERLRKLEHACTGPLAGFQVRLERAVGKANAFMQARREK